MHPSCHLLYFLKGHLKFSPLIILKTDYNPFLKCLRPVFLILEFSDFGRFSCTLWAFLVENLKLCFLNYMCVGVQATVCRFSFLLQPLCVWGMNSGPHIDVISTFTCWAILTEKIWSFFLMSWWISTRDV